MFHIQNNSPPAAPWIPRRCPLQVLSVHMRFEQEPQQHEPWAGPSPAALVAVLERLRLHLRVLHDDPR
jgi:hypothetical protein